MKRFNTALERLLMAIIALMWLIPLPLKIFFHYRTRPLPPWMDWLRSKTLTGMQPEEVYVPANWKNIVNAKCQAGLADEFNTSFAGRELLIRVNDEIYFRLLKTCPIASADIVVGKNNVLYEAQYAREYCLLRPDAKGLADTVEKLKEFQALCDRRGIPFVLMIAPSKAAIYPEYLPDRWMKHYDPRPRGYDLFTALLRQNGIRYVDGHAISMELKQKSAQPLFPIMGIHWTEQASLPVANAVAASLRAQGMKLQDVDGSEFTRDDASRAMEHDLERVMNIAIPWVYPVLRLKPHALIEDPSYNAAAVGGSFIWNVLDALSGSNQFSEIDCYYYYTVSKYCYIDGVSQEIDHPTKPIDFEREIWAADCIIMEVNEQQLAGSSSISRFLPDALAHPPMEGARKPFFMEKYATYQWGQDVAFRAGAPNLLGIGSLSGFSFPETKFTWSAEPEIEVRLNVPPADGDMVLEITGGGYSRKGELQNVDVYANKEHLGRWKFAFMREGIYKMVIPARIVAKGGKLTLDFHIEHPVRPADIDRWNHDTRQLGVHFSNMRLTPAEPAQQPR